MLLGDKQSTCCFFCKMLNFGDTNNKKREYTCQVFFLINIDSQTNITSPELHSDRETIHPHFHQNALFILYSTFTQVGSLSIKWLYSASMKQVSVLVWRNPHEHGDNMKRPPHFDKETASLNNSWFHPGNQTLFLQDSGKAYCSWWKSESLLVQATTNNKLLYINNENKKKNQHYLEVTQFKKWWCTSSKQSRKVKWSPPQEENGKLRKHNAGKELGKVGESLLYITLVLLE